MNSQPNNLEEYLKEKIFPDLKQSRGGFDKIHTQEVVDWLKQIIDHNKDLKLDKTVMLIAAYAHDWGYSGLFRVGEMMDLEKIKSAKKMHMIIGAKKITKLLEDNFFSFLTDKQKYRIIHLVFVHDKKFEIKNIDELVLMEADMLSFLQVNSKKPVLDAKSNKKAMEDFFATRLPKFITKFGKNEAKRLIQAREDYFKQKRKNC